MEFKIIIIDYLRRVLDMKQINAKRYLQRIFCLIVFSFFACDLVEDDLPAAITSEVNGKYLYRYSTGEIEVLFINPDSTYQQLIYKNEKSYLKDSLLICKNTGQWSLSGKEIYFKKWLMCSDFGLDFDTAKYKPNISGFSGTVWRKPNKTRKQYKLYCYYENGYVFTKQTDTIPVYHVHNTP